MSGLPTTIPGAWTPSTPLPYSFYFGFGSSNQVYSQSLPVENVPDDGDGENQPSRPYIPDAGDSVNFASFGSSPNDAGGEATFNIITLQPADATHPGGVSVNYQEFGGDKRFIGAVEALSVLSDTYIEIPPSTSISDGVIRQAASTLLHTYGVDNLFLGQGSGNFSLGGGSNVCVGSQNMVSLNSGVANNSFGVGALRIVTDGGGNCCFGTSAGLNIETGNANCCFGLNSGSVISKGDSNIFLGPNTGAGITNENRSIEIGDGSLAACADGRTIIGTSLTNSCFIAGIAGMGVGSPQMVVVDPTTQQLGSMAIPSGVTSLAPIGAVSNANGASIVGTVLNLQPASSNFGGVVTTGTQSWAGIKTFTAAINLFPSNSLGVGTIQQSGVSLLQTHGTNNTFLGQDAGNFTLSGSNDTAVGINALKSATTSSNCVAVGSFALGVLTTGSGNVAVGNNAGGAITTGQTSVYVGNNAGGQIISSLNNVFVGTYAGFGVTTGSSNVFIGPSAGFSSAATCQNATELSDGTMGTCVTGDIRIGQSASLKCYIAGIANTTTLGAKEMVVRDPANRLLETMSLAVSTNNYTATLDVGSITTMTVRGSATTTVPIGLTIIGKVVTMTIPRFSLTAQTGAALTINLSGGIPSAYRPTYNANIMVPVVNNAVGSSAVLTVTTGGVVALQLLTGAAFILPMGPLADLQFSWNIA